MFLEINEPRTGDRPSNSAIKLIKKRIQGPVFHTSLKKHEATENAVEKLVKVCESISDADAVKKIGEVIEILRNGV